MGMHHRTITSTTRVLSVQAALEWAFATEKAQVDFDQYGAHQFDRVGIDPLWRAMRMKEVGCTVDGGGYSDPHADATIIAGAVETCLPRQMALTVVEPARARRQHSWKADATRRIVPHGWDMTKAGEMLAEERNTELFRMDRREIPQAQVPRARLPDPLCRRGRSSRGVPPQQSGLVWRAN